MKSNKNILIIMVFLLSPLAVLQADTVYLKNGGRLDGKIISQSRTNIRIRLADGNIQKLNKAQVSRVQFGPAVDKDAERKKREEQRKRQEAEKRRLEEERRRREAEKNETDPNEADQKNSRLDRNWHQGWRLRATLDSLDYESQMANGITNLSSIFGIIGTLTEGQPRLSTAQVEETEKPIGLSLGIAYHQPQYFIQLSARHADLNYNLHNGFFSINEPNYAYEFGEQRSIDSSLEEALLRTGVRFYQNDDWRLYLTLGYHHRQSIIQFQDYRLLYTNKLTSVSEPLGMYELPLEQRYAVAMHGGEIGIRADYLIAGAGGPEVRLHLAYHQLDGTLDQQANYLRLANINTRNLDLDYYAQTSTYEGAQAELELLIPIIENQYIVVGAFKHESWLSFKEFKVLSFDVPSIDLTIGPLLAQALLPDIFLKPYMNRYEALAGLQVGYEIRF